MTAPGARERGDGERAVGEHGDGERADHGQSATGDGAAGDAVVGDAVVGDAVSEPRRVAPWIALAVAFVLAGLFVVLVTASGDDGATADSPLLGRTAPEAVGEYEDGSTFDLARRKGSWVVLNFFTADCVPCIQEHPDLLEFSESQAQLGPDGAELYSIVVNDTRGDVEEFFDEYGGDWPVIYSDLGEIPVAFGVSAVPETWIIDPAGIVRVRIISKVTAEQLDVTLQQLREAA